MWIVDAAPRLLDDAPASPELALVDVALAEQLRSAIASGDDFRPRVVPRPELELWFDNVVALPVRATPGPSQAEPVEPFAGPESVDSVDTAALRDAMSLDHDPLFLEAVAEPAGSDERALPDYLIRTSAVDGGDDGAARSPIETVSSASVSIPALDVLVFDEAVNAHGLPVSDDPVAPVLDSVDSDVLVSAPDERGPLLTEVLASSAASDDWELPDYIVRTDAVHGGDDVAAPPAVETPVDANVGMSSLDGVVSHEIVAVGERPISDYPELPDLGGASVALEETDDALRRIREQLVSDTPARRGQALRRRFMVISGLGAIVAVAVFALDVQHGLATVPTWLGF